MNMEKVVDNIEVTMLAIGATKVESIEADIETDRSSAYAWVLTDRGEFPVFFPADENFQPRTVEANLMKELAPYDA